MSGSTGCPNPWFSLPLALLYVLALDANLLILITIQCEPSLHQPMNHFLVILAVVDIGLATTIMPKILAIVWFDAKIISFPQCFAQIYAINSFMGIESGIFLCMAVDRYVVICYPLQYPSIVTKVFVIKVTISVIFRHVLLTIPLPILVAQWHDFSRNESDNCLCSNLGVISLACDVITINQFCQLALSWVIVGSDMGLVFPFYALIIHSVMRLDSAEATFRVLNTCSSHLIFILFFYTAIVVVSVTHPAKGMFRFISVLLNVLHSVIPPALNPMVYALTTWQLRVGFWRLLGLDENVSIRK